MLLYDVISPKQLTLFLKRIKFPIFYCNSVALSLRKLEQFKGTWQKWLFFSPNQIIIMKVFCSRPRFWTHVPTQFKVPLPIPLIMITADKYSGQWLKSPWRIKSYWQKIPKTGDLSQRRIKSMFGVFSPPTGMPAAGENYRDFTSWNARNLKKKRFPGSEFLKNWRLRRVNPPPPLSGVATLTKFRSPPPPGGGELSQFSWLSKTLKVAK